MTADDDFDALNTDNPLGALACVWRDLGSSTDLGMAWFVGLLDDRPAGFGVSCPVAVATGGYGAGTLYVAPAARRHGLGRLLRDKVEDHARGAVPGLVYSRHEDDLEGAAAGDAWGLTVSAHHHESVLDLTAVDRDAFEAKIAATGVRFATLPALDEMDEAQWHALHAFMQDRLREAPDSADGGGELPLDAFRGLIHEPWMLATAEEDGATIGVTFVVTRAGDATMNTFFTGVSPAARGRGVAGALKAYQALLMADRGVRALYTQNMAGNAPILAANSRLGFVRSSGYVDIAVPFEA